MGGFADVPLDDPIMQKRRQLTTDHMRLCDGWAPDEVPGALSYTLSELEEIGEVSTTLLSYVNESRVRFITGELDLDKDWDSYIDNLNSIGLERFTVIAQDSYDRANK